jgi:hypothetical protein
MCKRLAFFEAVLRTTSEGRLPFSLVTVDKSIEKIKELHMARRAVSCNGLTSAAGAIPAAPLVQKKRYDDV